MRLALNLDLIGLERLLAEWLPLGGKIRPTALELDHQSFRLHADAPLAGKVVLVAKVDSKDGGLVLSNFDLEGARLVKAMALGALRQRLAELDERRGGLRVWGEPGGDRLHLDWTAATT